MPLYQGKSGWKFKVNRRKFKMICKECGMELKENSKKCSNCGSTNIKDNSSSKSFCLFILLIIFIVTFIIAIISINSSQEKANMRRLEDSIPKSNNSTK